LSAAAFVHWTKVQWRIDGSLKQREFALEKPALVVFIRVLITTPDLRTGRIPCGKDLEKGPRRLHRDSGRLRATAAAIEKLVRGGSPDAGRRAADSSAKPGGFAAISLPIADFGRP